MPSPGGGGSRSSSLCRRAAPMPGAGAVFEGNCPFEGACKAKAALAARTKDKRKAARALSRSATLSARLPEVSLTFLVVSLPDRGRGDVMGLRPLRSPLPTPRSTPLALAFACTSLWPGQFLGKTDACHKPLGNRHHAHPPGKTCTKGRRAFRSVSGRSSPIARIVGQS